MHSMHYILVENDLSRFSLRWNRIFDEEILENGRRANICLGLNKPAVVYCVACPDAFCKCNLPLNS